MKIYMASSQKLGGKTIILLQHVLKEFKGEIFYPQSIGIFANTIQEMDYVSKKCSDEIKKSNVMVAIFPFGISVSVEIGKFLEQQELGKNKKLIILDISDTESDDYKKLRTEAMVMPHVYKIVYSIEELKKELELLSACETNKN